MKKGVSSPIAIVILVSVTLSIAVIAILYLFSAITLIQEKSLETMMIKGDSYIIKSNGNYIVRLHIFSNIKPEVIAYAVEISGYSMRINNESARIMNIDSGYAKITDEGLLLKPGTDLWIEVEFPTSIRIGNYVEVKVYTKTGYVYKGMLSLR